MHGLSTQGLCGNDMASSTASLSTSANNAGSERDPIKKSAVTFYFAVFPCNCSPIFDSNHVLLPDAPPLLESDIIYIGQVEGVAHHKLQQLAFPSGFGSSKGLAKRTGPLWSMRVEKVRGKDGVVHHQITIISTFAVLVASGCRNLQTMQTRYVAAALVVRCPLNKPYFQLVLESFDSVLRNMLHVTLDFAMWAAEHFFRGVSPGVSQKKLISEIERHQKSLETYFFLGCILANAISPKYTIPRLYNLSNEMKVALPLSSFMGEPNAFTVSAERMLYDALCKLLRFSADFASRVVAGLLTLSDWERCGLVRSAVEIREKNEQHRNSVDVDICSVSDDDDDVYCDYWKHMDNQKVTAVNNQMLPEVREWGNFSRRNSKCDVDSNDNKNNNTTSNNNSSSVSTSESGSVSVFKRQSWVDASSASMQSFVSTGASGTHLGDALLQDTGRSTTSTTACFLSPHRMGRVVIFCTDYELARHLLTVAAFFFRDGRTAPVFLSECLSGAGSFAGKVESCAHPSLPVQWVAEEYDESRINPCFFSPHSVDNAVLVIAPHANMLCRRLRMEKTFSLNPVLVEKFKSCRRTEHHFCVRMLSDVDMLPDAMILIALRESLRLARSSCGVASCAAFLETFCVLLVRSCFFYRLQRRNGLVAREKIGLEWEKTLFECASTRSCAGDAVFSTDPAFAMQSTSSFFLPCKKEGGKRSFFSFFSSFFPGVPWPFRKVLSCEKCHLQMLSEIVFRGVFGSAEKESQLMNLLLDG